MLCMETVRNVVILLHSSKFKFVMLFNIHLPPISANQCYPLIGEGSTAMSDYID